jgi:hypothetical protein
MKPNFALSLSFEGIKLLHRAAGGWREVGEVSVSTDDLAEELAMLRKTASSLEPGGVRTKLVIPASQIKYLTIETMGLSDAARRKEAETALEGATPYAVSELAYDICMDGAKTHVAAVARETLAEAEAFATEHRFHPVSFVAVPGDEPYLGEPFFGPTKEAESLLDPSESVEPDGIAVVVVGAVPPQAPKETVSEQPAPETPESPVPAMTAATAPPAAQVERNTEGNPEAEAKPDAAASQAVKLEPQPALDLATPAGDTAKLSERAKAPKQEPKTEEASSAADTATPADAETTKASSDTAPLPTVDKSGSAQVTQPTTDETSATPENTRAALVATAASNAPATAPKVVQPTTINHSPSIGSATISQPGADSAATSFASRRNAAVAPPRAKAVGGVQRIAVNTPRPDSSSLDKPAPAPLADQPLAGTAGASEKPRAKSGFFSRRKPRTGAAAPIAAPSVALPATGSEEERMTVFGARAQQVGGKPRFLGLIMTVFLLVFLVGVAAWAAVFLDEGIAGLMKDDRGRATASAPENQIDPEIIRTPDGIDANTAPEGDSVQIAALDPVLSAEDTAVLDAMQEPRAQPEVPVISEAEAAARYAVTGIWPLAPETPLADPSTPIVPVYRSGIDPVSTASDALALPAPNQFETDVELAAVVSPPPFGQTTQRDESGMVVPTPEGVVTPEGYTLIAASPPLKPPAALDRSAAAPEVVTPQAAAEATLVAFRPQNRPVGLAERTERAQLGGVTFNELAVFRPALRPSSVQERARQAEEEARQAEEAQEDANAAAASTAAAAAAAASALVVPQPVVAALATPVLDNATRLAIAQSRRPDTRPRNFDRIVNRAQRDEPVQETRVAAAAASVTPRTVTPSIPSKTSVAQSATVPNAINLRKINLIGVYGKPDSRRALIRLSNGRYQKVQVGDRVDGGRVAAISNSELRYTKGGRNVVLQMP